MLKILHLIPQFNFMKKHNLFFVLCLLFTVFLGKAQPYNPTRNLAMDPSVKVGKLKNGLTYYIKKNEEPKNRAQLRLVVKAGSILETDNQRGLAHFLEHMQFNGTKNFPKNELVNFLEKSGIKFGADLNAYTSFDETVYMLPVPSDTLAKLEKYLTVLSDWANKATLDHNEIDKERGVVLEEARLRKGAQSRIQEQLYPVIFRGSRYADRLPIGLDSIIQNAPYSAFKEFHQDWYRPDLQAVVAVGDFDVATMEKMIIKLFGEIKGPSKPKKRMEYAVPLKGGTEAIVITDKEQPYNLVQLYYLQNEKKEITEADRREAIMKSLFNSMIQQRLQEKLQTANPPYQFGASNYSGFLGNLDALQVFAVAKGTDIEKALIAVLDENERVAKFGFTDGEFERAKVQYKTRIEKQFNEKDKTDSENFVEELVQCFLNNVVMTDISYDFDFVNQNLDGIKVNEVNQLVKKMVTKENRVLAVLGSEKDKDKLPSVARLKELLDNTGTKIEAYVDEAITQPLIEKLPTAATVISEKKNDNVNVTELVFSNGVKVNLKPTDFKNDEIKFRAVSWGGQSLYEDKDFENVSFASSIASTSGMGNFKASQLQKYLAGKTVQVNAIVGPNSEVIIGSSAVKDLETALQMVYSRFTNNNLDQEAVTGFLNNQRDLLANFSKTPTPEKVYRDTLQAVLGNYNYRSLPMDEKKIEKVNPERALQIFNERFSDGSDFEFTFVGNFEVEKIKPLLATYLGGLPSKKLNEKYNDRKIYPPSGNISKIVKKGTEDKASVSLIVAGEYKPSDLEDLHISALGEILSIKLTEKLREEEGGVYSPYAFGSSSKYPTPRYTYRIGFGCSPANVDKLVNLTNAEIEKIRKNGPEQVDIDKFVNNQKLEFEKNLKNNDYWLNKLVTKYQDKADINSILTDDKLLNNLSVESLKLAANKYMSGKDLIKVILLPEDK
jgi:zinc protease